MTPRELIARLRTNANALLAMGALEFMSSGRDKAKLFVDDLLTAVGSLFVAGSQVEQAVTAKIHELEARIDALEGKPKLKLVDNAVREAMNDDGKPNGARS